MEEEGGGCGVGGAGDEDGADEGGDSAVGFGFGAEALGEELDEALGAPGEGVADDLGGAGDFASEGGDGAA